MVAEGKARKIVIFPQRNIKIWTLCGSISLIADCNCNNNILWCCQASIAKCLKSVVTDFNPVQPGCWDQSSVATLDSILFLCNSPGCEKGREIIDKGKVTASAKDTLDYNFGREADADS